MNKENENAIFDAADVICLNCVEVNRKQADKSKNRFESCRSHFIINLN